MIVCDPVAGKKDVKRFYGADLVDISELKNLDCLIIAMAHKELKNQIRDELLKLLNGGKGVVVDVKSIRARKEFKKVGCSFWGL